MLFVPSRRRARPPPETRRRSSRGENISRGPATASPATPHPRANCSPAAAHADAVRYPLYFEYHARCDTGIGKWTADEFYSTMHAGRLPDGGCFIRQCRSAPTPRSPGQTATRSSPICRSVPSVKRPNRPHDLRFPYNNRTLILGWRTLFFPEGAYQPDSTKSEEWNRGAYLVEGLGHCAMCHTAINTLGGNSESEAFEGGLIPMQNWYAPSLTSRQGRRTWRLEHGGYFRPAADGHLRSRRRVRADGRGHLQQPAVHDRKDIRAMAVYLKSLRGARCRRPRPTTSARKQPAARLGRRSTPRNARAVTAKRARESFRLSPACRQSVDRDGSAVNPIRMVLNGGFRRALRAIRSLTECRRSPNRSRTTRSRRW